MSVNPKDFDNLDDFFAALDAAKKDSKATRQPRQKVPAAKPYPQEKEFVTMNYFSTVPYSHTQYKKRDEDVQKVVHLYGMTDPERIRQICLTSDIVVLHPHSWHMPCSPAPAQQDCRVIKERKADGA